jgi:hypothetical protein
MKTIKFSHRYFKVNLPDLEGKAPDKAKLLQVFSVDRKDLSDAFVLYDTEYWDGYYLLPKGKLLVLLFKGENDVVFTTIRSNRKYPYDKEKYYRDAIGEWFEVKYE